MVLRIVEPFIFGSQMVLWPSNVVNYLWRFPRHSSLRPSVVPTPRRCSLTAKSYPFPNQASYFEHRKQNMIDHGLGLTGTNGLRRQTKPIWPTAIVGATDAS